MYDTLALAHDSAPAADVFGASADAASVFAPDELRALARLAQKLAGRTIDPDDLLHDAIERALRSWDRFERGSNLFAWMRTIMYRLAIDQTRGRRRHRRSLEIERWALEPAPVEPEAAFADGDSLSAELGIEDIRWGLAQLSESLRAPYEMFALEGRSYADIGTTLGIPWATVGTRLLRARRKLRELLEERARRRREPVSLTQRTRGRRAPVAGVASCRKRATLAA
jgi:RNA polymerase sigma-70 factor, ECF subfamily